MSKNFHPFTVHQNEIFKKLLKYLEKHKIIQLQACKAGRKVRILNKKWLDQFLYFIFLSYFGFKFDNNTCCINLTNERRLGNLHIYPSIDFTPFIAEIHENPELLFNSLIAIYLGSFFCFEFLYPNTYIIELGKKTHELDICGCINKNRRRYYIIIETTRGRFDETEEGHLPEKDRTLNWHFKKTVLKKWAIEKIFKIDCYLIYLSVKPIPILSDNHDDKFVKGILDIDTKIHLIQIYDSNLVIIKLSPFSKQKALNKLNKFQQQIINPIVEKIKTFVF